MIASAAAEAHLRSCHPHAHLDGGEGAATTGAGLSATGDPRFVSIVCSAIHPRNTTQQVHVSNTPHTHATRRSNAHA
jgi:hypothetical protein